ncbi:MAG: hypothetical protein K8E24_013585 [Methanobacterium paludis]|nr:hypothetical protein [Methanobacterium paludis]
MYATYLDKKKSNITPEIKNIARKELDYNHGTLTVSSITIGYSETNSSLFVDLTEENRKEHRRAIIEQKKAYLARNVESVKKLYKKDSELTAFTSLDCEEFYDYK